MTGIERAFARGLGEVAAELIEDLAVAALLVALLAGGADAGRSLLGAARATGGTGRALVARQQLDDLLADAGQVGAELDEHLCGDALALTDEAQQDVLGADVVVAELQRLAQREFEDLLGARGEGDVTRRRRAALADDLLDLAAHGFERDAEALECLGRDAFTLVDQPEQDVLGSDVAVIQEAGLLLCEHHDPAGPVGETFEHGRPFHNDDVSGELSVHPTGAPLLHGRRGLAIVCRSGPCLPTFVRWPAAGVRSCGGRRARLACRRVAGRGAGPERDVAALRARLDGCRSRGHRIAMRDAVVTPDAISTRSLPT